MKLVYLVPADVVVLPVDSRVEISAGGSVLRRHRLRWQRSGAGTWRAMSVPLRVSRLEQGWTQRAGEDLCPI